MFIIGLGCAYTISAQETSYGQGIQFSIPAGQAQDTLSIAADQADIDLVFQVDLVQGITTSPVNGVFDIESVLRMLIQDSGLSVYADSSSGVYAIYREENGSYQEIQSTLALDPKPETTKDMNQQKNTEERGLVKLLAGLLTAITAVAPPSSVAQDDLEDDNVYLLSPFVIDASEDTGYTAQSTLAGTRIRSEVRELGSSITILTEEFLDDTGATDAASLLTYTANTEVGGVLGNFSAGSPGSRFNGSSVRRNPQNGQRVRGLTPALLMRDYFNTMIPFDQYNTSRVTINRGPNAVLFGIGNPGGVINNSLNQAILNETINEIQFRFDHRGSTRGSVDFNRSIIEDRLALRVNALYDKLKYQQEPAEEEDQRIFLAFNAVLFENADSDVLGETNFRGHLEFGTIDRIPPSGVPLLDSFRTWFDGYGDLDSLLAVPGIELSDLRAQALFPDQAPNGRFIPKITHNSITNASPGRVNTESGVPVFISIPFYYESGDQQQPGWSAPGYEGLSGGMGRNRWPGVSGRSRQDIWSTGNALRRIAGFNTPTLQNTDIFDYRNNLLQGTINTVESEFEVQQFTLDQSFFEGMAGIEFSYNRQRFDQIERLPLSAGNDSEIYIDISEFQSNDLPNPNLGRPFVRINNFNTDYADREQEVVRFTAFVDIDIRNYNETLGKWLGRHTLTGLYEERENDSSDIRRRIVWGSDEIDVTSNAVFGQPLSSGRAAPPAIVYVGPSALGANSINDVRITDTVNIPWPEPGERHNAFFWNHTSRQVETREFITREIIHSGDLSQEKLFSEAYALKSSFLDDHVVTILAWRSDAVKQFNRLAESGQFNGDLPLRNPDGSINNAILNLQDTPSRVKDETLTTSIVGFFPEEYLFELPFGMDLSFHYYEAESFIPSANQRNILGEVLAPPSGETTEYGFTLEFLERRLSLRVNFFETSSNLDRTNAGLAANSTVRIGDWIGNFRNAQLAGRPFSELGVPASAATSYAEFEQVILDLLPEPTRSLLNYTVDDRGLVSSTPIQNLTSTRDFVSEGMEIELVGAIRPNWSVALNIAQQETVQSNTSPALQEIIFPIEQGIIDAGISDVRDNPFLDVDVTFLERYQAQAAAPLRGQLAQDGTQSQEQREWRLNLVTNYDFMEGPLDGFSVGGALRWQDEVAVGYPFILDADGNQIPDIANAFFGDDELNGDIWFGYERPILDGKIDWKVQVNIRNAIRDDSDIPVVINPNGELAVIRIPPEQSFFITNTFRF